MNQHVASIRKEKQDPLAKLKESKGWGGTAQPLAAPSDSSLSSPITKTPVGMGLLPDEHNYLENVSQGYNLCSVLYKSEPLAAIFKPWSHPDCAPIRESGH